MTTPDVMLHTALADVLSGAVNDKLPNLRADGTLWSHAATLGSFMYGGTQPFTIDEAVLTSIVKNFARGYPQKVPVDYEHETQLAAKDRNGPPLSAGRIVEVQAVLTMEQLSPEMKRQLDAERDERQRIGLSRDVNPLGLWIRWQPTSRALSMVKAREVTEMSVVIAWDHPHKNTGEGQGPTLLSVALTNTPFLDDMISVAASRSGGGTPADPAEERPTMNGNKLMLAVAALTGKPAADEDIAVAQINERVSALTADVEVGRKSRESLTLLTAEIGVSDPTQAVLKVRELKGKVEKAESDAKAARLSAVKGAVAAFLKANEAKLGSVPMREHFDEQITAELLEKPELTVEQTKAGKLVASMAPAKNLGREAGADNGTNLTDDPDQFISVRANELLSSDAGIKEIAVQKGQNAALKAAILKAHGEVTARTKQSA